MKLTEDGKRMKVGHQEAKVIAEFLSMLGVDDWIVFEDAEGVEHQVQQTTPHRLERLAEYLRNDPAALKAIRKHLDSVNSSLDSEQRPAQFN